MDPAQAQQLWIAYAGGLGHGVLLTVREQLLKRDYEGATALVHGGIELIERIIFRDELAAAAEKKGGAR